MHASHVGHGGGRRPLTLSHSPSATHPQPHCRPQLYPHPHPPVSPSPLPPPRSPEQVEGLGHFRKYANGRLIGRFADRTIATLLPPALASAGIVTPATGAVAGTGEAGGSERGRYSFGWYLCHLVFPDGRTTQVRSDCPVGAEPHLSRLYMALTLGADRVNAPLAHPGVRAPGAPTRRGGPGSPAARGAAMRPIAAPRAFKMSLPAFEHQVCRSDAHLRQLGGAHAEPAARARRAVRCPS